MTDHAESLLLFINNDGDLYKKWTTPTLRILSAMRAGVHPQKYTREKAISEFLRLVVGRGADEYAREHKRGEWDGSPAFTAAEKRAVANVRGERVHPAQLAALAKKNARRRKHRRR